MDLEDSLLSEDLMSYVTGEATPESSASSTPGEKSAADIKNISLARMKIRQSIDQTHKNSVNHLIDPRAIYLSLVNRYAASNKARLRQLIRMMYDVSTQTHRTVQEKVDDLKRLRAQINSQDKDIVIHEQLLICFLQMSMDDAFDTTIEILNASTDTLTMEKVQSALESKELELADVTIKGETAQFAGRRARNRNDKGNNGSKTLDSGDDSKKEYLKEAGGCWCCGGMHLKHDCAIWRQTKAGKAWLASEKGKARVSLEGKEKANATRKLDDSGSESEKSAYLPPNAKVTAPPQWYLDSCASVHITPRRDQFISALSPVKTRVEIADGSEVRSRGKGDVRIFYISQKGRARSTIVRGVHYIPDAASSLLSVGQLEDRGAHVVVDSPGKTVTVTRNQQEVLFGHRHKRVWRLSQTREHQAHIIQEKDEDNEIAQKLTPETSQRLLHARLGHPGKHMEGKLDALMDDLGNQPFCPPFCPSCTEAKMTRKASREPMSPVAEKLERVHMDLWGPVEPSLQGMKYMLTITDQATGRVWVYFSRDKMRIVEKIKAWIVVAEAECRQYGKSEKVMAIRFDRGKEFLNEAMKVFCSGRGIRIEPTVGYHPEGNGISERSMRTISERGAAMRHEMDLPAAYWEFSNAVAAYLRNRGVVKGMAKSPWELWRGEKPKARHLRVFGCPAWVLIPKEKRTKLDKKAWQGVFVGYKDETDKVYLVWNPADKKVHEVRFVEFDESKYMDNTVRQESPSQYDDEKEDTREQEELTDDETDAGDSAKDNITEQEAIDVEEVGGEGTDGNPTDQNTADSEEELRGDTITVNTGEADISSPGAEERLSPSSDTNSSQPKTRSQIRREAVALKREAKQQAELERRLREEQQMAGRLKKRGENGRKERAMIARTLLQPNADIYDFDPKKLTFRQAMEGSEKDKWVGAIDEEVQNLIRRQTFSEEITEDTMQGKELVDAKLVFDHKKDKDGKILRYKARLVARGFTQKHGVNYEETFAPTIRLDAMRIILALAAKQGWKVYQMDAVAAFLAADLKEEIFMKVPTELQQHFGKYVQILKSLYGLKQAARMWGGEVAIEKVKEKLKGRFEMKDLGEAENILGIRIQRYKGKLIIDQSQFAKETVAQFLYDDSMKHATPMEPEAIRKLVEEPGRPLNHDEWLQYVELLGKLIWLCNTRFDIIFAVNRMASFTVEACWNHWKALLRILGYVSRTIHYGITYGGNNEHAERVEGGKIDYYSVDHNIEGHVGSADLQNGDAFSDTDYATDPRDRKSILGFVFLVYGGAVMTYSKKMKSVARSTTEAEYVGMGEATKAALWGRRLLAELEGKGEQAVPLLLGDNKGAVQLTRGVSNTSKIKHIDIAFHHVVDEVKEGRIQVYWVPGENMLADGMTKPLPREAFERNRKRIGIGPC
ncbi:copia-like retrotransposable element, partial [Metarhizium majus ARSEF 297]